MEPADGPGLRFDRREFAGSLGDLGTILPLASGLILVNGLDATGTFVSLGMAYALAGLYFRVPVPVEPMKVIGACAIATAAGPACVSAAGLCMGLLLLLLSGTGAMALVCGLIPRPAVRGIQLATGALLVVQGVLFILGLSALQQSRGAAEPFLAVTSAGPIPVGLLLGPAAVAATLLLARNRTAPAALVVVVGGAAAGVLLGGLRDPSAFHAGIHLPRPLPFGWPSPGDFAVALTALVLPQFPVTIGNAIVAEADLTREYFGDERARRSTPRALAVSMGFMNLGTGLLGGMPLCHGAGGLAAHYRFGARTAGSNLIVGGLFLAVGIGLGDRAVSAVGLLPFAVLGALLCFAGAQLIRMARDVTGRGDRIVVVAMLGASLAAGLAVGFGVGLLLAHLLRPRTAGK